MLFNNTTVIGKMISGVFLLSLDLGLVLHTHR